MNRTIASLVPPSLIALFTGGLYFRTLSPGLTWAFDGADGGDFLTALATGGVPHPGGYPTYMLLASLFVKLPLGELAWRANLLSGVCTVVAVFMFYRLVKGLTDNPYVASVSSLILGTFPLVWSQALITEVYALQLLFAVLILDFFLLRDSDSLRGILGGMTVGLALGMHLTTIFLVPFIFVTNQNQQIPRTGSKIRLAAWKPYLRLVLKRIAGLCLGLGTFLAIPIRAHNQSPVNWGYAIHWNGFWWLVSGEMYRSRLGHFSAGYLLAGLQEWSHFLLQQMGVVGLAIGLIGLVILFQPSRPYLGTCWLAIAYSLFSILYSSPDSYVYLIPVLMAFALWIGLGISLGIGHVLEKLREDGRSYRPLLMSLPVILLAVRAIMIIPEMDLSNDHKAEDFGRSILASAPPRSILLARGDEATFALWYFHFALRARPDVAVVAGDLFAQPWYREVLGYTYPDLTLPVEPWTSALASSNPGRAVCTITSILPAVLDCGQPSAHQGGST